MIFHLAIPAKNLKESTNFYVGLGAKVGRVEPTHVVLKFYGCQLVLHQSKEVLKEPTMYPRHLGVIVDAKVQLEILWDKFKKRDYVFENLFQRKAGKPEEHWTFFLKDPSNNLVEFKWYKNDESIFT